MSEFHGHLDYVGGEPALLIFRKIDPSGRAYAIRQTDAWKFSEEHNEYFVVTTQHAAAAAYKHLDIGGVAISMHTEFQRMADLANVIQKNIDALLDMPPAPEEASGPVIGEAKFTIDGKSHEFEVR